MSEHTATPWHYTSEFEAKDFCGVRCMTIDGEPVVKHTGNSVIAYMIPSGNQNQISANAALIVRAVNAHAGLLRMTCQVGDWLEAMRLKANAAAEQNDLTLRDFILDTMPDGFMETLNSVSAALEAEKEAS